MIDPKDLHKPAQERQGINLSYCNSVGLVEKNDIKHY